MKSLLLLALLALSGCSPWQDFMPKPAAPVGFLPPPVAAPGADAVGPRGDCRTGCMIYIGKVR